MNQNKSLSPESVAVLIEKLNMEIAQHMEDVDKLETLIGELAGQVKFVRAPGKRRLPPGMPQKFVIAALTKHGDLTMAELRRKVEEDTGHTIRDGTARRALEGLMKKGKVTKTEETGAYEYIG